MFKSWQTCWCQPVFLYTSSVFNRSSQDNHCASPTWSAFAIPMPMSKPSTRRCRDQIPTLSRTGRAIVGQLPAGIPKRVHSTVVELWMCRMWTLHVILIVNFFPLKSAAICFARKHGVIVTFSLNGGIVSFCVVAKNVVGDMPFDRCSRNVNSCPQNHPQIRTIFFSCAVWTFPNNSNGQFFKPMCLIDCFRESQTHDWKPWSPNDFHKWALLYFAFPVARWTSKTMSMTAPGCPGMSPPPQKPTQLNCLTIQKRWCYHGLPIKTNQRKYAKCVA